MTSYDFPAHFSAHYFSLPCPEPYIPPSLPPSFVTLHQCILDLNNSTRAVAVNHRV